MTPRPANICVNSVSAKFAIISISSYGILFALFSLDLYLFVYPPLALVHQLSAPTMVVNGCSSLVVLDDLLYVPPLEVHHFCLGVLEMVMPVVLGISTVFCQFL